MSMAEQEKKGGKCAMNKNEFEIKVKASILKKIVDSIVEVSQDAKLIIDEDGLKTDMNNPGLNVVVSVVLKPELCEEFKARKTEIGVDLKSFGTVKNGLKDVLRLANADDIVTLSKENGVNLLKVEFGIIRRRLPLLDLASFKSPRVPKLALATNLDIKASLLTMGLKAANQVDDKIIFEAKPEKLLLRSQEHSSDFLATMRKDDELAYYDTTGKDISMYSIEFIQSALKEADSSGTVTVGFSKDNPIKISYSFEEEQLSVDYIIAPLIRND